MRIELFRRFTPGYMKKKKLKDLFRLTAEAFQSDIPELKGLTLEECLVAYARFTNQLAERCLEEGHSVSEVKSRLYETSCHYGRDLRKRLCIRNRDEAKAALEMVYWFLGVDFRFLKEKSKESSDGFVVERCFFSTYYSAAVCEMIASLDEGLASGLAGGSLSFDRRITDGSCCCEGNLTGGLS